MKVVVLTNNLPVAQPLADWLSEREKVTVYEKRVTVDLFADGGELSGTGFIVSYNYSIIIRKDVIDLFKNRIINLHISILPYNKGCSPNLWSFIDNTPKGVTIHAVSPRIDEGGILLQNEVAFADESVETLESSYNKLHAAIQSLFFERWGELRVGAVMPRMVGGGSYHTKKDSDEFIAAHNIRRTDTIAEIRKRINAGGQYESL